VNTNGRQALARRLDWCLGRGISREGISSLVACPENGLIPGLGLAFRRPPKARGWSRATDKPDAAWLFSYDAHLARTWLAHRDDVRDCQEYVPGNAALMPAGRCAHASPLIKPEVPEAHRSDAKSGLALGRSGYYKQPTILRPAIIT